MDIFCELGTDNPANKTNDQKKYITLETVSDFYQKTLFINGSVDQGSYFQRMHHMAVFAANVSKMNTAQLLRIIC